MKHTCKKIRKSTSPVRENRKQSHDSRNSGVEAQTRSSKFLTRQVYKEWKNYVSLKKKLNLYNLFFNNFLLKLIISISFIYLKKKAIIILHTNNFSFYLLLCRTVDIYNKFLLNRLFQAMWQFTATHLFTRVEKKFLFP